MPFEHRSGQEARMLLPGLRAFLAVAQAGSMREAAARLRLAQSAVSRRIQMMEEELGVALLERGARGVALTPAGEILLHHAREASQQAERLVADLDALRGVRRGHVAVRTVESFAASTLPHVLGSFRSAYPAVTLDVTVAGSDAILAAVRDRLCHFGIAFNPPADPEVEILGSVAEPLAVAVGPGHPLSRAKRVSLAQVAELPLVAPARLGGSRLLFDAACRAANAAIRPALETNSAHVVAAFLADDQSVAILSPGILSEQVASGRVIIRELAEPLLAGGRISLLTRRGRRLPPAAEALGILLARALHGS
jgi:DNA-binding transcriptional LysR family regulator